MCVFRTKNDSTAASKQNRNDCFYVKSQENENNNQKKLMAIKETSNDQRYERYPKNRNDYNGQNYRKDEKENVNVQKNTQRTNSGNQIYSQNQKYIKRDDNNQNFRRDGNYNYNQQNNRGYYRNQEKSNYQNNYHRNDAKNRNNYQQNSPRNQQFHQNDNKSEPARKSEPFKKNNNGNSFPQITNYSKLGTSPENQTSGIHYQRTFSPKTMNKNFSSNVANNQAAKSVTGDHFIPQTEQFAQLDLSSENCTSNVENVYSNDNSFVSSQFQNLLNANTFSNDLFSDQFTAGISEPIITNIQNDAFRNTVQFNQQSNIPVAAVNFTDNYRSSSQPLISDNFNDCSCSYSNNITSTNILQRSNECQFMDQFASNNIPTSFSSLSPEVADFIPRKNQIQTPNQMEFSSPLSSHQERSVDNPRMFSFSTPNSNQSLNSSWLSQNDISDCTESINLGNDSFQSCIGPPTTFNQRNTSDVLNDIFNRQQAAVPDTSNNCQTFNFNGRIVNLSDKRNQIDTKHPPSYDNVQNFYYQDDSIGDQLNYDISINSGTDNYSENLNLSNQQLSNILQIASLNLNQDTSPVSSSGGQHINDMLLMSNLNVNVNQAAVRQTNASVLSQSVVNSSNRAVCNVMQNSRVNTIQDYYKKSLADAANNLKCDDSEQMNSQFEIVAQQLFNVNKYVTSAEMNGGTISTKDSVCDTNARQFNIATFKRCKNEMEKYRQSGNFSNDRGINTLSSNNSKPHYDNIFTPASIESSKPYDTFSSQTFVNSNFIRNEEQQLDIGSRYNDGIPNNNPVLPTEFAANMKTPGVKPTNDFQNNCRRANVPMNSNARYRCANTSVETNTSPQNHQYSYKNEFSRSRRIFNNQVRIINNAPTNSMTINVRDDCFINFTRKGWYKSRNLHL